MKTYESYFTPRGKYRKYLLKQELLATADLFDAVSKLLVRSSSLLELAEVKNTTNVEIIKLSTALQELYRDLRELSNNIFKVQWDKDAFCEVYDKHASIVEEMEERVSTYLDTLKEEDLTEDAHILKKRTRTQKNPVKDPLKVQAAKNAWARNKHKYKNAIKKFHQSSQGKAFHRNLSRYNKFRKNDEQSFSEDDILLVCKGISSMLTHLLIEIQAETTQTVESVLGRIPENAAQLKEIFDIFQGLLSGITDAFFNRDHEAVSNVM
jgi:hypothetical protein